MRLQKLLPALLLSASAATAALFLSACVDNKSTLYVDHVVAYDADEKTCSAQTGLYLGTGSWDPAPGRPYVARMVLGNQLMPLGDNDTLRPETSRIALKGAEIQIEGSDGSLALPAFTTNFAATIHPDESEDPGFITVEVPLIPAGASTILAPGETYNVKLKVFGETLAGTEIESGEFVFPVLVLQPGDLMRCESDADLIEAEVSHPCGPQPQDNFYYSCLRRDGYLQVPGCLQCP